MTSSQITANNIGFSYNPKPDKPNDTPLTLFDDFNFNLKSGKVSVILGPSGCGKTTLLNIMGGIIVPDKGEIIKSKESVISFLFQDPRLVPWKTVSQNIEYVLKNSYEQNKRKYIVKHYIDRVELNEFENCYPSGLSGGMRQRVAIARAFAYPSDTILMDEPFKTLDPALRQNIINLFKSLWIDNGKTALIVTHDINEAAYLGDDIYILSSNKPVHISTHLTNKTAIKERTRNNIRYINFIDRIFRIMTSSQFPDM